MRWGPITNQYALDQLCQALSPLIGTPITYLQIPVEASLGFEPSQIGTIVGTLTDATLPTIALRLGLGLTRGPGILGEREGYPDFIHEAGYRVELKGLFCDNPAVQLKRPPTRREPSARLTQKVTVANVVPDTDALLLASYHLELINGQLLVPVIRDIGVFPVIECVRARDFRLAQCGGIWFGAYETPAIPSKIGKGLLSQGMSLDNAGYGRKESEGKHYNEDTNFGKMKRIPYQPLQEFLERNGASFTPRGAYPQPWVIRGHERDVVTDDD